MSGHASNAVDNPFSTRRIRPGALPFLFPSNENADTVVQRLRRAAWRGEIVGPHGSGKSTLLASLTTAIEQAGRSTIVITLHDGQRRLPLDLHADRRLGPSTLLIVDGYEQLSWWSRAMLKRFCRRRCVGLLVTAHQSVGLPTIFRTAITPELARRVVDALLDGCQSAIAEEDVRQSLVRHSGDLRETLFELYDIHQQRSAAEPRRNAD